MDCAFDSFSRKNAELTPCRGARSDAFSIELSVITWPVTAFVIGMIQARDLRLVYSHTAKQFHAMRAGVSDLQCCVARQLVLHARIELLGVRSARVSINHRGGNRTTGLNQRKAAFRRCGSKRVTEWLSRSI